MTKTRILGLDTGTNSLGWAIVDRDELSGQYELIYRGDLIFTEGVKVEKGKESSKAADRTQYRSLRKQYFRRRLRKIEVLRVLSSYHLCPPVSEAELHQWHVKKIYPVENEEFMLWQRTNDNEGKNPYYYRHICLHTKLDLTLMKDRYILGRALYHLSQRRGFLSNRLDQSLNENAKGAVKTGISSLSKDMSDAGCLYLGDYFYKLYSEEGNRVRIRNHYTARNEHYLVEFEAICKMQQLEPQLVEELRRAIFFQRPLKSQRKGVGKCTFEPRKPRCADSHPDYEEFRKRCFVNNIKIQTPDDDAMRPLNEEERQRIDSLFYRVSKANFDFEEIARLLGGENNYCYYKDEVQKDFKFNYRMSQGVSGCPTIAQLRNVFGKDWKTGIAETYQHSVKKDGTLKTADEMADDIWNVLYSFSSKDCLYNFAINQLQLDANKAEKFSKIKLSHGFASISLNAIHKIQPFLCKGMIYSHAVLFANIPSIVGQDIWSDESQRQHIMKELEDLVLNYDPKNRGVEGTIEMCIKDFLQNNYDLPAGAVDRLYHPSMIETYPDAKTNKDGVLQLGSPATNAIRNPMAMRSLHELRHVVNRLLREGKIDQNTEVHVEYARELNDANKRKAIGDWQRKQDKLHKKYRDDIIALYKEETGKDINPTPTDILKFQLWEEQEHICLYTGRQIGISKFLGPDPEFDIEHTVPRSVGGDSTQMNMTLCERRFNREVKKAMLPSQLPNYQEILSRIEKWKKKYEQLTKDIDHCITYSGMSKEVKDPIIQKRHRLTLERDYWRNKYERFTMTEVPEGFSRRQGAGIGLVSKYAGLFLKSLFHDPADRRRSHVYVVKGATTAEFRKMWGLQSEYEKKSRENHTHHCIDAITIACIGRNEYNKMASFYHDEEAFERGEGGKPHFDKPWPSFTQDVLELEKSLIVVHSTPDNMPKRAKKYVRMPRGKFIAKGDCARGSLHLSTYYGAIKHKDDAQPRYVLRRELASFESVKDIDTIVDDVVRDKVKEAVEGKTGKAFKEALADVYMNKEKGIRIKKVRCYVPSIKRPIDIRQQRDQSRFDYKRQFHVANDGNYMMAIYEGVVKGKPKREFELVKNIEAANYFKASQDKESFSSIIPEKSTKGFPLRATLKIGTHVLLYENSASEVDFTDPVDLAKRLYKVVGLSSKVVSGYNYGDITLRFHQEARQAKEINSTRGLFKNADEYRGTINLYHTQLKALVEGYDFDINILGEITSKQ